MLWAFRTLHFLLLAVQTYDSQYGRRGMMLQHRYVAAVAHWICKGVLVSGTTPDRQGHARPT
jgi:hypothetical protein